MVYLQDAPFRLLFALRTLTYRRMAPLFCSLSLSACASSTMHTAEDHQSFSNDTYSEEGITFHDIAREIAEDMIAVIYDESQDEKKEAR